MSTVYTRFEEICQKINNDHFIIWRNSNLNAIRKSHKDVLLASQHICNVFEHENVPPNTFIGVMLEHNILLPAVILGINKHDASFFCFDMTSTKEKNAYIIGNLNVKYILFNGEIDHFNQYDLLIEHTRSFDIFNLDLKLFKIKNDIDIFFPNICYGICTSGTTGDFKTVLVFHQCIMSNVLSLMNIFRIDEFDTIFLGTPVTFDPFIIELFLSLITGASLVIVSQKMRMDQEKCLQILYQSNVTFLQMPPSLFFTLYSAKNDFFQKESSLRILALGGEKFPDLNLIKKIHAVNSNVRIFNLYGITEVSCWASTYEIDFSCNNDTVPLGKPLADTIFEIRDKTNGLIENGIGELFIGSKTRICLVDKEDMSRLKLPVFRETGDIVKIENNNIYFLHRKNDLIKKFGHKVSLSQIEEIATKYTCAPSACIWNDRDSILTLFIVESNNEKLNTKELKLHLLKNLPKGSNPDKIQTIFGLPVTKHGKIDKKSLLDFSMQRTKLMIQSSQELFQSLICQYCIDADEINFTQFLDKSFMNIGGSSILAIQVVNEFERISETNLPDNLIGMLIDHNTTLGECCKLFQVTENNLKWKHKRKNSNDDREPVKNHKSNVDIINKENIQILWKYDMKACVDASPVIGCLNNEDILIIGSHSHKFSIINIKNGTCMSECELPDRIESTACLTPCNQYGIVGCYNGYVYCINLYSGDIKWDYKTDSKVKCTPVLCQNNKAVVIGSYDKNMHCFNIETGIGVWRTNVSGSITASPLIKDNCVYCATTFGNLFCLRESDGHIIWNVVVGVPVFGSACTFEKQELSVIVWPDVKGKIHFLNRITGKEMCTFKVQGTIYSSLIYFKGDIYFGCHDQYLYCLTYENGSRLKFKIKFGSEIFAAPYLYSYNDKLFCIVACCNGIIQIMKVEDLTIFSSVQLPGEIFSTPILYDKKLYIGCRDDFIYCIDILWHLNI